MKSKIRNEKLRRYRARRARVVKSIGRSTQPRLTVYRSAKHIYAQLSDPVSGQTIGSVSTRTQGVLGDGAKSGNIEGAKQVGKALAALAKDKQIDRVVFNRNGFLYHGRVKALADAAREAGLAL